MSELLALSSYDPGQLLDFVIDKLGSKNDAGLCKLLGVAPPVISKIRHRNLAIGATILLKMHELTGVSIRELRKIMGDHRHSFFTQPFKRPDQKE